MTAEATERCYYLDDYYDEVMPCYPSLAAWAEWLSQPDEEWGRDQAASDGDTFGASVIEYVDDVIATRTPEGWTLSHEPADACLIAVRFGPGLGWDADSIVGDISGLIEHLDENDGGYGDVEHIAIGMKRPPVRLTFHAGPPPLLTEEQVQ